MLCWVLVVACRIFVAAHGLILWLPHGVWNLSSQTRDRTRVPSIGMWVLNHWTTREVLNSVFNFKILTFYGHRKTVKKKKNLFQPLKAFKSILSLPAIQKQVGWPDLACRHSLPIPALICSLNLSHLCIPRINTI